MTAQPYQERPDRTVVSPELYAELVASLEAPPEPEPRLQEAFRRARQLIRRPQDPPSA